MKLECPNLMLYPSIGLKGQRFEPETFSTRRRNASDATSMFDEKKKMVRLDESNEKWGDKFEAEADGDRVRKKTK